MAALAGGWGEGTLAKFISKIEQPTNLDGHDGDKRHEDSFLKEVHKTAANIAFCPGTPASGRRGFCKLCT